MSDPEKNALLIVAHGSRRAQSNDEIQALTEKVAVAATDRFDLVDCAYLELAEPSIPEGIEQLAAKGATSVLVVPYFLARGTHVATDIPEAVDQARASCPAVNITISDYFGASSSVPDVLINLALEAPEPERN